MGGNFRGCLVDHENHEIKHPTKITRHTVCYILYAETFRGILLSWIGDLQRFRDLISLIDIQETQYLFGYATRKPGRKLQQAIVLSVVRAGQIAPALRMTEAMIHCRPADKRQAH